MNPNYSEYVSAEFMWLILVVHIIDFNYAYNI